MSEAATANWRSFAFRGTVAGSSRIHIRLKDLMPEVRDDQWTSFRLAVNAPISVFYYDDKHMQFPEECILVDISTGGCCISSERLYGEGEALRRGRGYPCDRAWVQKLQLRHPVRPDWIFRQIFGTRMLRV